jgi:hypothetical protein
MGRKMLIRKYLIRGKRQPSTDIFFSFEVNMKTKASNMGKIMTTVMGCWLNLKYLMDRAITQVERSTQLINRRVLLLMQALQFLYYIIIFLH